MGDAGFEPVLLEKAVIRRDRGEPIEGLVVVAERRGIGAAAAKVAVPNHRKERPEVH
jgi:hypothetical protein